jgi:hypothetical protein
MNTKKVTDKAERKKLKRTARKKAAPKPKRPSDVARGSRKQQVAKMVTGQSKRYSLKKGTDSSVHSQARARSHNITGGDRVVCPPFQHAEPDSHQVNRRSDLGQ